LGIGFAHLNHAFNYNISSGPRRSIACGWQTPYFKSDFAKSARFVCPSVTDLRACRILFVIVAVTARKGTCSNYLLNLSYCLIKVMCFLRLHVWKMCFQTRAQTRFVLREQLVVLQSWQAFLLFGLTAILRIKIPW